MYKTDMLTPGWKIHDENGFLGHVGPILQCLDNDQLVLGFKAEEKHRNRRDRVQGGMLMTLIDRAMGQTLREEIGEQPVATVQLDAHFVTAAHIGDFIEARAKIVRLTRNLAFLEGQLTAGETIILTAKGIWKRPHATNQPIQYISCDASFVCHKN